MSYTIPVTKEMACAQTDVRASHIATLAVCKRLNRKQFAFAKELAKKIVEKKADVNGKYYTKASKAVLNLLESVEHNAKQKNLNADQMTLNISCHKGPKMMRGRHKSSIGTRLKLCKVEVILMPTKLEKIERKNMLSRVAGGKKTE